MRVRFLQLYLQDKIQNIWRENMTDLFLLLIPIGVILLSLGIKHTIRFAKTEIIWLFLKKRVFLPSPMRDSMGYGLVGNSLGKHHWANLVLVLSIKKPSRGFLCQQALCVRR